MEIGRIAKDYPTPNRPAEIHALKPERYAVLPQAGLSLSTNKYFWRSPKSSGLQTCQHEGIWGQVHSLYHVSPHLLVQHRKRMDCKSPLSGIRKAIAWLLTYLPGRKRHGLECLLAEREVKPASFESWVSRLTTTRYCENLQHLIVTDILHIE